MKRIEPYLSALQRAGNLDLNQAKIIAYYCVMTHSEKPKKRPILNICGESGTGKTGIQRQVLPWCNGSKWINARNKTAAQIRDDLADVTTAVIEEIDKTLQPRECENWIQQRYDEGGICVTYKRPPAFTSEDHNHFGYTIVHTQNAFKCIELDRRTIKIPIFKDSQRPYKLSDGLDGKVLAEIAQEVDWEKEIVQPVSNSAWDAWYTAPH